MTDGTSISYLTQGSSAEIHETVVGVSKDGSRLRSYVETGKEAVYLYDLKSNGLVSVQIGRLQWDRFTSEYLSADLHKRGMN